MWFSDSALSVNGYERVLDPPTSIQDVCYWLNKELELRHKGDLASIAAINCAVEESSVGERSGDRLLPQDLFLRDTIESNVPEIYTL